MHNFARPLPAICIAVALGTLPFNQVFAAAKTVAAAGLVEPKNEERIVIAESVGKLKRVYIDEGDRVTKDQLLAEIENSEQTAVVTQAKAVVALREASLKKLKNGARAEEIQVAASVLAQREADLKWRGLELERRQSLRSQQAVISQQELDLARAQYDGSVAARDQAKASLAEINNGARSEDIAVAQAQLDQAKGELDRAIALLEKTQIRSPVNGVVLKRELREGESVTTLNPLPLARIGDMSQLFVRAEIDELDIALVAIGQHATITADALAGKSFGGKIVRVSKRMGRRQARSDNPAEKQDTRVLEALIALDGEPPLPVGLRVDVKIDGQSQ
jgi:HlyD family secretion protein